MLGRLFLVCMTLALATRPALAGTTSRQVRYLGGHPIPAAEGGGFCEIEGPHVHIFAANKLEYRPHDGFNFFVGDPVAYGYAGPRHSYKGHHAIHVNAVVGEPEDDLEFCYIDGPHFHAFAPSVAAEFTQVDDTYFYVAEPPPVYLEARPALIKINAIYAPLRYERPRVVVEPPRGWIGVRAGYAVPIADVEVRGPAVIAPRFRGEVYVPAPSVEINLGVGIGVGVDHHHHHDNGKHKGWGKKRGRHW